MEARTREQILDQIKSIMLKTDPTRGASQAEVEKAMEHIATLRFRHDISMEEINTHVGADERKIAYVQVEHDILKNSQWRRDLMNALCYNMNCRMVTLHSKHNNHRVALVGQRHNVEIVTYLFDYLRVSLESLAEAAYGVHQSIHGKRPNKTKRNMLYDWEITGDSGKSWKATFYQAAVRAINSRLAAQRKVDVHTVAQEHDVSDESIMALVVAKDEKLKEAYDKYFPKETLGKPITRSKINVVQTGWAAGHEAGYNIPLRQGIEGERAPKLIGG